MKQQPTKEQIAEYLISNIIDNLVVFLMEDEGIGLEESLDKVYGSEIIKQLQDKETGLYLQSPAYVYEMMGTLPACRQSAHSGWRIASFRRTNNH